MLELLEDSELIEREVLAVKIMLFSNKAAYLYLLMKIISLCGLKLNATRSHGDSCLSNKSKISENKLIFMALNTPTHKSD